MVSAVGESTAGVGPINPEKKRIDFLREQATIDPCRVTYHLMKYPLKDQAATVELIRMIAWQGGQVQSLLPEFHFELPVQQELTYICELSRSPTRALLETYAHHLLKGRALPAALLDGDNVALVDRYCRQVDPVVYERLVAGHEDLSRPLVYIAAWGGEERIVTESSPEVLEILAAIDEESTLDNKAKLALFEREGRSPFLRSLLTLRQLPEEGRSLESQLAATLDVAVEDFGSRYLATFGAMRVPLALVTLISHLKDYPELKPFFQRYVMSVLQGTFHEARYDVKDNAHLAKIAGECPEVFAAWQQALPEVAVEIEGEADSFNFGEALLQKFRFGHHNNKYDPYAIFDDANPQTPFEKRCKELLETKPTMADLEELLTLVDPTVELFNDIKGFITILGKREPETGLIGVDCDDYQDLLLCGTEVPGSCLRVDGYPKHTRALIAYIMDGKYRLVAVKDPSGRILARAVLRLLWNPKTERPALFQEVVYGPSEAFDAPLAALAMRRAAQIGCPLFVMGRGDELLGLGSSFPYEYVDAAGGIFEKGCFSVEARKVT